MRNAERISARRALGVIKFTDCPKQVSTTLNSPKEVVTSTGRKKIKSDVESPKGKAEGAKRLKLKLSVPIGVKVKALMQKKMMLGIKSESHSKQTSLNTSIDNLFKERKASIGGNKPPIVLVSINAM